MAAEYNTLSGLFRWQSDRLGDRPALRFKRWGVYADLSWNAYRTWVDRAAAGWLSLGIALGDRLAVVSENRVEWLAADLSILAVGAANVSIHSPLTAPQVAYQLRDSGARWAIVSSADQLAKIVAERQNLPQLEGVVCFDAHAAGQIANLAGTLPCFTWDGLLMRGRHSDPKLADELQQRQNQLAPNQLAAVMYTSGTTGEPKGVMLTHGNLLSNATATFQSLPPAESDVLLSWLPYSHIYARLCDHYSSILSGCTVALAQGFEQLMVNLKEIAPTHMSGVPRFYEKVWESVEKRPEPERSNILRGIFGPRLKWLSSGGAPLPAHVAEGFWHAGIKLLQGYGLTESSPVIAFNTIEHNKIGTIGRAIPGVEVQIAPDGELLARGPNIMAGYWNKPEATAEAIDADGWLHTGDLAQIDRDGFLSITGRKKDLIVLSNGKKVAPALVESLLVADEYVDQAVVHGDRRSFLSALIVPNFPRVLELARQRGLDHQDMRRLLDTPEIAQFFEERVLQRLSSLSPQERVKRFVLLDRAFTIADEELTTTLKYRRDVIFKKHEQSLESLYRDHDPVSCG